MNWWWLAVAFVAGMMLNGGWRRLVDLVYPGREDKMFKEYLRREYGEGNEQQSSGPGHRGHR